MDNGFKTGFQRELEKGMKKLLPGTDLVANPNINSKIHVWKKDCSALSDLLSKSGIGWNDSTHTIDVFNEGVWEAKKRRIPIVKLCATSCGLTMVTGWIFSAKIGRPESTL